MRNEAAKFYMKHAHEEPECSGPKVLNRRTDFIPRGAIYVGRPTKFGNPFVEGRDGTRLEVIEKFREWLVSSPEAVDEIRLELAGKDLVCWCSPKPCHADVLLELVNQPAGFSKASTL